MKCSPNKLGSWSRQKKKLLVYSLNQQVISLTRQGSLVMSPLNTTQNGSMLCMPLFCRKIFINPGVKYLHNLSCALPLPALLGLPSTHPSCLFNST